MIDLDDIDLDVVPEVDIGEQPTAIITAPVAPVFPPVAGPMRGEMFFDLETIPDESRRPLFGLDEPVVVKPTSNPNVTGEAWVEWMKRPIAQIKDDIADYNPDDTWLEAFEAWERKSPKPRQGVLDIAKSIRTARNPAGDSEADKTKKMSVTPEFCRIVAIGIGFGDDAKDVQGFVSQSGSAIDEVELLEWWWDCAKRASTVAGYNIIGFDLPVIYVRSAILGVKPTRKFDMRPWGTDVLDLMATRWPRGNQMKLKELARVMGLDVPAGDCDGSQVATLYRDDPVKLAEYVKSDVIICQQLRRMWRGLFC
jgi:hypothetical protein